MKKASSPKKSEEPLPSEKIETSQEPLLSDHDYEGMKNVLESVKGMSFDEIKFCRGDICVSLRNSGAPVHEEEKISPKPEAKKKPKTEAAPKVKEKAAEASYSKTINAPLVGTFYTSSGPGKPPLVKPGDVVKAGDPVCVVEAMKLFNEIKAAQACKIIRFLVKDAEAVAKNQPLIAIEDV